MLLRSARARRWLDRLLHTHDTPRRTAAAFAIGVFFGFSPFLGLHTVLGLVVAFAFGLNRVAVLLGVYSNLPWIVPAYYTLTTLLGAALLGVNVPPDLLRELRESLTYASWSELTTLARRLTPLLWAFGVGSTAGAVALAVVAYCASLAIIVTHRRLAAKSGEPVVK
jgi:hypothetical protein